MQGKKLYAWDTEFSADSAEWCPVEGFQDILVVGTYQVDQSDEASFSPSQRKGRIFVLRWSSEVQKTALQFKQDFAPILDMKWNRFTMNDRITLATADAKGCLTLFFLNEETFHLEERIHERISQEEGVLALSLDWSTKTVGLAPMIAVSDSKGNVCVFKVSHVKLERLYNLKTHDFEAWITCFDANDSNLVFSGGDDSRLKVYDLRCTTSPIAVCKEHQAGVTSLLSLESEISELLSGSYDEMLCHWDSRNMKQPMQKTSLEGGVWRIKQHPHNSDLLATACMNNGFKIIDRRTLDLLAHYREHESLAYGIDWKCAEKERLLASCSFYDHLLTLWALPESE